MAHRSLTALELHQAIEKTAAELAQRLLTEAMTESQVGAEWHSAARTLATVYGTSEEDTYKALEHRIYIERDKLCNEES